MKQILLLLFVLFNFDAAYAAKINSNKLTLGGADTTNKEVTFNGVIKRAVRSNQATGKLEFTHDGSNWKTMGSGGAGGSGVGINAITNGDAEDGLAGWIETGNGALTIESTLKNVINGDKSFKFAPVTQNDTASSPATSLDFKKYYGVTCELGIQYYGADENLELHIVDANGKILNGDTPNNRKIPKREFSRGPFSVSYFCPTEAAIIADANVGNLHVEIKNIGVGISPAIIWDLVYVGDDRNLGTTTLPDGSVSMVSPTGEVESDNSSKLSSCTNNSTGDYSCLYSFAPTVLPGIGCTVNDGNGKNCSIYTSTLSGFSYQTRTVDNVLANSLSAVTVTKQGADAQQKVQTYKAIPVVSESMNEFSAKIKNNGDIKSQNSNWISGCVYSGLGDYDCTFVTGIFTQEPSCSVSPDTSSSHIVSTMNNSITNISFRVTSSGNAPIDRPLDIKCSKQGADYVKPQTKNISLAGIVVNSYAEQSQKQRTSETCRFLNNGTVTADSPDCNFWIVSGSAVLTGQPIIQFGGAFSSIPTCFCVARDAGKCAFNDVTQTSMTQLHLVTRDNSGIASNISFNLTCTGDK